jgi:hypothetical protein
MKQGQGEKMAEPTLEQSVAEIWALFKETDARLDERFRETDARLDERFRETDARLDERFRETDARLDERFRETDARLDERFRETDATLNRYFRQTSENINRLEGLFHTQWGKMMEALVQPNALKLFQDRGIQVQYIYPRAKSQKNGDSMEIDLILENGAEIVVVEAKSTLGVSDVRDFLDDLAAFTKFFPKYASYRIYGAVAGLDIIEDADRFAYRQGLFVLNVVGDGMVQIKNDEKFQPHDFGSG